MPKIHSTSLRGRPARMMLLPLLGLRFTAAALEPGAVVVFDAGGFADESVYPPGELADVAHGESRWHRKWMGTDSRIRSEYAPGKIVAIEDRDFDRALRITRSGKSSGYVLDFPAVAGTRMTISFDARVSTVAARTLDVTLARSPASSVQRGIFKLRGSRDRRDLAWKLFWGRSAGKISAFPGGAIDIDTDWHRYDIVCDLNAFTYDVRIDGKPVITGQTFRGDHPPGTAFGRLRIGSIRDRRLDGVTPDKSGEYALLANLRISADPAPPAIHVINPVNGVLGGFAEASGREGTALRFLATSDQPIDPADFRLNIDGVDVSDRLVVGRAEAPEAVSVFARDIRADIETPRQQEAALTSAFFRPGKSYRARLRVENSRGWNEREIEFRTREPVSEKIDGYRGIWFTLGQMEGEYGDKYAGGLAFCFNHTLAPMAVYAPEVDKTFFVYGGTTAPDEHRLRIMAAWYDHAAHRVPRPTIVLDQGNYRDPHDNPSITIDDAGHVWVFVAGRARVRPGQIFRGVEPWSVETFEEVVQREQTYSQIWHVPGKGFMHLLTLYTHRRELYWETSADGRDWTIEPASKLGKLAGFGGHYQVSRLHNNKVGSAFNYHPGGSVDRRTNLYYVETDDFGQTWRTVDGRVLETPLKEVDNPALVIDYQARGRLNYICKLVFDDNGHPVILGVTSRGHQPGPSNDPRIWEVARWTGSEWKTHVITESDHNYDAGSLYIDGDRWSVIGPALPGPQPYHTGGEVGLWVSTDQGATWDLEREITRNSPLNHSYVRRPHNPKNPFYAMWADGDSSRSSISRIFFCNSTGDRLYMLPFNMDTDFAEPILIDPPVPPAVE